MLKETLMAKGKTLFITRYNLKHANLNILRLPEPLLGLLHSFEINENNGIVVEMEYGPQHFTFIIEATRRIQTPPITVFRGNKEMRGKTSNKTVFDCLLNFL